MNQQCQTCHFNGGSCMPPGPGGFTDGVMCKNPQQAHPFADGSPEPELLATFNEQGYLELLGTEAMGEECPLWATR